LSRGGTQRWIAGVFWFVCMWLIGEVIVAAMVLWKVPQLERMRLSLLGEERSAPVMHRMVGQPYLSFSPAPGFRNKFGLQHNEQGFRGREIPMRRTPGVARVLCLGGSTIYGWSVEGVDETLPAQIEARLATDLPAKFSGVEVINGGIPTGTSAESLTHYQFKFHYFRPDVVLIEAGGNDSMVMDSPVYQPDYSHWRRLLPSVDPLPPQSRWMMHSRILGLAIIFCFRSEYVGMSSYIHPPKHRPATRWYPDLDTRDGARRPIQLSELAYRHHLEVLLDLATADGAVPVLVPFRMRRDAKPDPTGVWARQLETVMAQLAAERQVRYVAEPDQGVDLANYTDVCHLNAAGESQKAANLAPVVRADLLAHER